MVARRSLRAQLVALATPLSYSGAPRQTVTPMNEHEILTLAMAPGSIQCRYY